MMDGREGMSLQGTASYYLNRGGFGGSNGLGHNTNVHSSGGGSATTPPPGFTTLSNPNIPVHSNLGVSGVGMDGNTCPNFEHEMNMSNQSGEGSELVKKKRGRPRKYGPDRVNMSLALSSAPSSEAVTTTGEKPRRGRPPGTGWKQKLAPLGEWMFSSAGLAFTPHVLHIGVGEDIAAKILAFAQQRPRALCIMSGSGAVSAVTFRQPTASGGTVAYEGHFEILCLSGSYLVSESGDRTGGISISVCTPDGHMMGGAIGGRLVAANLVQVVACSFVYNCTKAKNIATSETIDGKYKSSEKTSQADIDLMRG